MVSIRHVLSTVFRRLLNQRSKQVVKDSNFVGNIYKVNFNNNNSTKLELNKEEEVFLRIEKKNKNALHIHTYLSSILPCNTRESFDSKRTKYT